MGFFKDIVSSQLIDVIEWVDNTNDTIVHKYDMNGKEIMMGAQLTVRESQKAIFVNEGEITDVFTPGRYELSTQNMPIMTKLKSWKFGFNSPFKSDVYFINTKQFLDCKWGTANPVMMRDSEFGMVRIRAFGIYSFRIIDPETFLREVFGTNSMYKVEDIDGQIKRTVVSTLTDSIAESQIPALDLATNYDELSEIAKQNLNIKFKSFGIKLETFVIENISLPEEVEKVMDRRTSMGVLGDLNKYSQYQAAEAMRESANQPGNSMAGMGVGMGAGAMMGQMFTQSMNQNNSASSNSTPSNKTESQKCMFCGNGMPSGSKFCPNCGKEQKSSFCPKCGNPIDSDTKFCPNCGEKL